MMGDGVRAALLRDYVVVVCFALALVGAPFVVAVALWLMK